MRGFAKNMRFREKLEVTWKKEPSVLSSKVGNMRVEQIGAK